MSTFQKQRFKGSGGNPQSPGAFGTFLVEKYTSKDLSGHGPYQMFVLFDLFTEFKGFSNTL